MKIFQKNCLNALLLLTLPLQAVSASEHDEWGFAALFPMVWVTDINGTIKADDNKFEVDRSFQDTLDSLSFGYMAEFYAQKGPWRYALKLNYSDSDDETITQDYIVPPGIPVAPSHKIQTDTVEGTTDVIVGYTLDNGLLLYGGLRYIYSEIKVEITPLGSGIIEIEEKFTLADENLYDWLVGFEYQHELATNWSLIVNADAAIVGDNDKDYAANIALTFKLSKLNTVWAGYRYLRIADKMTEDGVRIETDFITKGPTIGWAFTF